MWCTCGLAEPRYERAKVVALVDCDCCSALWTSNIAGDVLIMCSDQYHDSAIVLCLIIKVERIGMYLSGS